MATALILTEKYLKAKTTINENVDMKLLTPAILEAQEVYIHPLLGSDLYDEIISQIIANTVTAANQTLIDNYVLPCLVQYAKYEAGPEIQLKLRNKGIMQANSDNSNPAEAELVLQYLDRTKNKAEMFAGRCRNFLVQNITTYPKYALNPDYDDIKPSKISEIYKTGLALDDPGDCCEYY